MEWNGVQYYGDHYWPAEATTGRLMMDDDECGAVSGMLGRGNRSTRKKHAPVPLCPPKLPHDQTRAWTWAAAVGSRQLTAWALVWPNLWPFLEEPRSMGAIFIFFEQVMSTSGCAPPPPPPLCSGIACKPSTHLCVFYRPYFSITKSDVNLLHCVVSDGMWHLMNKANPY
jgi:hypothetical protein